MSTLKAQFSYNLLSDHFEADPHHAVSGLAVNDIHVLHAEVAEDDILVVAYASSPALSFYNTRGRLIDVDHYLPDNYPEIDEQGADQILRNLKSVTPRKLNKPTKFRELLEAVLDKGNNSLAAGLREVYGLETTLADELRFKSGLDRTDNASVKAVLLATYDNFYAFLKAYLTEQLLHGNRYVNVTPRGNIVITTLNKHSGTAVLIETRDVDGQLLPPNRWLITRSRSEEQLQQLLVFRSPDIRQYFASGGYETVFRTDRYQLTHTTDRLALDSLLDDTNNLLQLKLVENSYQVLAADRNVIVALTKPREVTIVNTHRSVVPARWSSTITLPEAAVRVRADENLTTLFAQAENGTLTVYDMTKPTAVPIATLPQIAPGFQLDATGAVIGRHAETKQLVKILTNAPDLQPPGEATTFDVAFQNLAHLFRGESLFQPTTFARPVAEVEEEAPSALPSAVESARYDFEATVEHLLAEAGDDYSRLLDVQEKIAIARTNIAEELTKVAEKEDLLLVGQRLQRTINNIVRPTERRVRVLVETTRARQIIAQARGYRRTMDELEDPAAYRDILNSIRAADEELSGMTAGDVAVIVTEFREIQRTLNAAFSEQISGDGKQLKAFITREIEQIEEAITNTHQPRQLEQLMVTHPAALELMNLLKQPFVLQSIASEQRLSPAGIQRRLHEAVDKRRAQLRKEKERQEAANNAAKLQLAQMIQRNIDFFVTNHSGDFSDQTLNKTAAYQEILRDSNRLETEYHDVRLARELRQKLERRILERNRADSERMVAFEGKYAYVKNDPALYVDLESTIQEFPHWDLEVIEKKGSPDNYLATFTRSTDKEVYRPTSTDNLRSGRAFEIHGDQQGPFFDAYDEYAGREMSFELIDSLWQITQGTFTVEDFPQFEDKVLKAALPKTEAARKALGCAREKKYREEQERKRQRNVPVIPPEFIDDTPYFQAKLREFIIKAKLQLTTGAGVLLLSGPPSTGKSAFLKFAAALMNREYFEHASDKWQTKNSLVTAIKFGEQGPYTTPAGFTKAVTTPHSLINIEEIKEWPEALRKSLNPFFAGADTFLAPDGTAYPIGDNILLCAAANLGAFYRQDDEPFTSDFWSRIEVVEYDYAPHSISREYYDELHSPRQETFLTMRDLIRDHFDYKHAPDEPVGRAAYFARQILEFMLLPKADEQVKRNSLQQQITAFFTAPLVNHGGDRIFGPEEAAKVALRRMRAFQGFSAAQFYDLYDHFVNGTSLRDTKLGRIQTKNVKLYEQLRFLILALHAIESCLRELRVQFYASAGQTELEGTNREFINAAYLLGML